ncbi:class II aldolase/adducin family protein [Paenalcaligenes niemegkensis]|uniref:class II aldolase/adducin family protein n=1 Tax=Paenalcaligenes niemegkensis TaxID=2895469 RepID=UPI001EE99C2B|nr:class II aldolase/adducin family protein [Paenalcaligenes niemegkensis]MCQ9617249.1 class II aldolase/adducin family protein [Paenalcaligenes niemegkensis]
MSHPTDPRLDPGSTLYAARPSEVSQEEWQARVDLAACYRLAVRHGWDDQIYTHISVRVPGRDDAYLMNPYGLSFEEITASNLLLVNTRGAVIDGTGRRGNPTGFAIHGAVHNARSDAHCVMHLHNDAVISVSALAEGLLPMSQHAIRFWNNIAYHDYEGVAFSAAEQEGLLKSLGKSSAMILRNHGSLVCGRTVAEAYVIMFDLDKSCRTQLVAMAASRELVLPAEEVLSATQPRLAPGPTPDGELEWSALLRKLLREEPDFAS